LSLLFSKNVLFCSRNKLESVKICLKLPTQSILNRFCIYWTCQLIKPKCHCHGNEIHNNFVMWILLKCQEYFRHRHTVAQFVSSIKKKTKQNQQTFKMYIIYCVYIASENLIWTLSCNMIIFVHKAPAKAFKKTVSILIKHSPHHNFR
jgi:hypothetical protein